jgi:hypothetical protein
MDNDGLQNVFREIEEENKKDIEFFNIMSEKRKEKERIRRERLEAEYKELTGAKIQDKLKTLEIDRQKHVEYLRQELDEHFNKSLKSSDSIKMRELELLPPNATLLPVTYSSEYSKSTSKEDVPESLHQPSMPQSGQPPPYPFFKPWQYRIRAEGGWNDTEQIERSNTWGFYFKAAIEGWHMITCKTLLHGFVWMEITDESLINPSYTHIAITLTSFVWKYLPVPGLSFPWLSEGVMSARLLDESLSSDDFFWKSYYPHIVPWVRYVYLKKDQPLSVMNKIDLYAKAIGQNTWAELDFLGPPSNEGHYIDSWAFVHPINSGLPIQRMVG